MEGSFLVIVLAKNKNEWKAYKYKFLRKSHLFSDMDSFNYVFVYRPVCILNHRGWVMQILMVSVIKVIFGLDNGLSPVGHQVIIWTAGDFFNWTHENNI